MYRPVKTMGDTIAVPQLLFAKLTIPGSDDGRFRVGLYLLSKGGGDIAGISTALQMPKGKVEAALNYWEGAGLIEREAPASELPPPEKRRKMTTGEVVRAGKADPTLGSMLDELQRLFGSVLGENDVNIFVSLYVQDGYPADLILMAASEAAANSALRRGSYTERILANWHLAGINSCAAADTYLKLQAQRAVREKALAAQMGYTGGDPFSFADKKKIAQWFEEFLFDVDMIETARLAAGDKAGDVKYLHPILKKWHAKGYRTARDVQQGGEGANLRAMRETDAPRKDILMEAVEYVPLRKRGGR